MTYGQIVGLAFIVFVLLTVLTIVKQFAIALAQIFFEMVMHDRKKKTMQAAEQKTIPYKGAKDDTTGGLDARNRIGFQ